VRKDLKTLRSENAFLRKAVKQLSSALAFYGSADTYFAIGFIPDNPAGDFMRDFEETELGYKPGKRARRTLDRLIAQWKKVQP